MKAICKEGYIALRIKIGKLLYGELSDGVVRVGPKTLIKWGYGIDAREVEAMNFVSHSTSIPVPKVLEFFRRGPVGYIRMEYIHGDPVPNVWWSLGDDGRQKIIEQLHGFWDELRALSPSPGTGVCSAIGGTVQDPRVGPDPFGPFADHAAFHKYLRADQSFEALPQTCVDRIEFTRVVCQKQYATKFTHGDLVPRNILIKDGKIAAIVDWENAGWFPEYWEYTKANFAPFGQDSWMSALKEGRIIEAYETELQGELELWRVFDCPQYILSQIGT